ncbi:MAG: hypothetical protein JOZ51_21480 [Chloroflexi bacterium]|nr:hypothetical protein [Chloroflexota bacterium]
MQRVKQSSGSAVVSSARPATLLRGRNQSGAIVQANVWGWLPALSLIGAIGVVLVALAHVGARYGTPWSQTLFWTGLTVMYAPLSARLVMPDLKRQEAIGLVLLLGLGVYLAKLLHSPQGFTFFDEFLHWRTANDILKSGHLFSENSLLPVSPLYPGLEIAANALGQLTGMSIFQAGATIVCVARLMLTLTLYLFYEEISGSTRIAAVASAIYMANPHYLFFDGQFAYESLALPLATLVLFFLLRRRRATGQQRHILTVLAGISIWAVVATHHATSYMLTLFLILWMVVTWAYNKWFGAREPELLSIMLLVIAANVVWLICVSSITIGYLAPHLTSAVSSVLNLISGEGSDRELFKSSTGTPVPIFEKLAGLGAPGLIMLLLPWGLLQFWLGYRKGAIAFTFALGALTYPVTLALRLTGGGWEISARSSVFVYIPLALVLALGIEHARLPNFLGWLSAWLDRFKRWLWLKPLVFAPYVAIVFAGGVIAGWSPWARMPWPYMVGADTRSVEPQGLAAAEWARDYLGPDNRIAADRINMTLLGTYGEQRLITHLIDKVSISGIFLAPRLGPNELAALRDGRIRYLAVDQRTTKAPPLDGHYYESWEKMVVPYTPPVDRTVLDKFAVMPGVDRLFDSGDLQFYDVGALWREP